MSADYPLRLVQGLTIISCNGTLLQKGSLEMPAITDKFGPLRKGMLEFAVLQIVSANKVYVADILKKLARTDFATGEGTLYPLLSRLRREELVDYEWVESEAGPPRKYYRLTATGQTQLQELESYWHELNATMKKLGASR
jgi:PadR family transcriptional regulator